MTRIFTQDLESTISNESYRRQMTHVDKPASYLKFGDVTQYRFTEAGKKKYDINQPFEENITKLTEGVHYQVVHYTEEELKQKEIKMLEEGESVTLKQGISRDLERGKVKRKHKGLPYYYRMNTIDDC